MKEEQNINGLMKDWKALTFGEIIDFLTDYQANGSFAGLKENVRYYSDKNFAVLVRLKDLRHELQNSNEFVYTDEQGYNFLKKSRVKEGDILVANVGAGVGTTLKMPKFDGYATLGPNMFRVDLKSNVLPKFFLAFSNSMNYWHQLNLVSAGSGQPKINKAQYRSIKIPIPPVETQQQIVSKIEELFSELDKGIEELKTAQQQLKVYRQAVLKWAFEGKLTNEDVNNGELLEGWSLQKFGEVTINYDGKRIPLSRDVRAKRQGTYRYYGATEIVDYIDDYIFDGEYLLIGEDGANLLSKTRPLAFIVDGKFWVNNHAHVLQAKENILLNFLNHYFNSINISAYVSGSAQPKLNQANMNKIPVPLPPLEEQQQIVQEIESRLSVCDKIEETITASLKQAEALRQSILKKAFEGKLL